jgi:hypothetical protein
VTVRVEWAFPRIGIAVAVAIILQGCALVQQSQRKEMDAQVANCNREFGRERLVERMACVRIVHQEYRRLFRYPDLQDMIDANNDVLAERYKGGKLTFAEAQLQASQFTAQVNAEWQRRVNARAANDTANRDAMMFGAALMQMGQAPPAVTCVSAGPITTCR